MARYIRSRRIAREARYFARYGVLSTDDYSSAEYAAIVRMAGRV
jgi:hypothetical protein